MPPTTGLFPSYSLSPTPSYSPPRVSGVMNPLLWCHLIQGPSLSSTSLSSFCWLPFQLFPLCTLKTLFHCKRKKTKNKNPWNLKNLKNNKKTLLDTFCLHTVRCLYLQAFDESWFCPRNISFLLFLSSKRRRSPVYCKTMRKWCQHYLSSKRPLPPPLKLAQFSFITFNILS